MTPATTWLASYPKSGNTWLRVFLDNWFATSDTPADINCLTAQPWSPNDPTRFESATLLPPDALLPSEIEALRAPAAQLDVHRMDDLPPFRAAATPVEEQALADLMGHFCAFVADYEAWVLARAGETHRRQALDQWMHKPCCRAAEIPVRWKRLQAAAPA